MKYRWANRRFMAVVPARVFGRWLTSLPDQNPATIVEAAASKQSVAHNLFQWDDSVAAHEHRLAQARIILGSFVIETEIRAKGRKTRTVDVPFVSRSGPGTYEITLKAMKTSDKRDFMVQEALREANRWRRRYATLSELAIVFAALDEVEVSSTRRKKRA